VAGNEIGNAPVHQIRIQKHNNAFKDVSHAPQGSGEGFTGFNK
jgi:hypothetical protein